MGHSAMQKKPADSTQRRVLVMAYYFPPLGLSGVQRVAGFVKYLPDYGWHPTVVTARPAGYFAYDESLRREVEAAGAGIHETRSMDPTRLFGKRHVVALPAESVRRPLTAVSRFLFLPDNKIGWVPFAIRAGKRLHQSRPFDAVFASAPPYSALLAALHLAKQHGLPLVVDFRDDWVGRPAHRFPSRWHRQFNARMERRVLGRATVATAINRVIRDSLAGRNPPCKQCDGVAAWPRCGHAASSGSSTQWAQVAFPVRGCLLRRTDPRLLLARIGYRWQDAP